MAKTNKRSNKKVYVRQISMSRITSINKSNTKLHSKFLQIRNSLTYLAIMKRLKTIMKKLLGINSIMNKRKTLISSLQKGNMIITSLSQLMNKRMSILKM
jgi:hypothetical protein